MSFDPFSSVSLQSIASGIAGAAGLVLTALGLRAQIRKRESEETSNRLTLMQEQINTLQDRVNYLERENRELKSALDDIRTSKINVDRENTRLMTKIWVLENGYRRLVRYVEGETRSEIPDVLRDPPTMAGDQSH